MSNRLTSPTRLAFLIEDLNLDEDERRRIVDPPRFPEQPDSVRSSSAPSAAEAASFWASH
jgi:hypothetical protein